MNIAPRAKTKTEPKLEKKPNTAIQAALDGRGEIQASALNQLFLR